MSRDPNEITGGSSSRDLWHSRSMTKEMRDRVKHYNMPQFTEYFSTRYNNLTPQQIEAEYSALFDDIVERDGVITPDVSRNFRYLLKEQLDASSGALGERLDMGKSDRLGKGDRLDIYKNDHGKGDRLDIHGPDGGRGNWLDIYSSDGPDFRESNRLDSGKGDRLGFPLQNYPDAQPSKRQDLVRALLNARQRRPTYDGPR